MKKLIIILVILGLLAGAGFAGYHFFLRPQLTVEKILPQNALFYLQLSDTQKNIQRMTSTALWKNLSSINYGLIASDVHFSEGAKTFIELFKQQVNNPTTSQIFSRFFGKEVALAIYPVDIDTSTFNAADPSSFKQILESIFSGIYLVTRIDPQVQLAEYISRSFRQIGATVTTQQINYKDNTIILVSINDSPVKLGYVRLKDLLVISLGEKAAKSSIDVYKRATPSLASDPKFKQALAKKLNPSTMLGYGNLETLFGYIDSKIQTALASKPDAGISTGEFGQAMETLKGFKIVSFSNQWQEILKGNVNIVFDKKIMKSELMSFYQSCQPADNNTLKFIPKNVLAYQWANCFDLTYYWNQMKAEMAKRTDPKTGLSAADQIPTYEQMLGLSIDGDILPAFGKQAGGYLQDVQTVLGFPLPTFVLFIEVADQAKTDKVLGLLKNIPMLDFQEQTFSDTKMHVATTPLGTIISPAYCYLDKYLLISNSKQLLENSITALKDQSQSLAVNPSFKEIDFGLSQKSIGSQFIQVDQLMEKVQMIVDWGNNWLSVTDEKKQAFKAGSEKRLVDIKSNIASSEQTIKDREEALKKLAAEITDMQSKGQDVSLKQKDQVALTQEVEKLKEDIELSKEKTKELEQVIKGYESTKLTPDKRSHYLEEVIYPLLKALKSIKTYGGFSTISDDSFETNFFIKL